MLKIFIIGIGGSIGAILRYLISGYVQHLTKSVGFPYGTLFVNVFGCFIIGILFHLSDAHGVFSSQSRSLIFIGILGSFTTFSTFGNETMNLFHESENLLAYANIVVHIVLGLGAVWLGRISGFLIWR
jgi:CrcB protein